MLPVVLRPEAIQDLDEARAWYEAQLPGLGFDFLTAVETALKRVEDLPKSPAKIYRGLRYFRVQRFPYGIFYQVLSDRVDVLAIVHSRRSDRIWKERLN